MVKKSREEEGGSENRVPKVPRHSVKGSEAGTVLLEVVVHLLSFLEAALPEGPSTERVELRYMRARLLRHGPASDVDVAQELAELEGDEVDG